jgi:hypothetical protein
MSLSKPNIPPPPAAAPPTPDLNPAEQRIGSENPTADKLNKRKKGRSALRIDLQHGGSGLSAGQTGVNVPTK